MTACDPEIAVLTGPIRNGDPTARIVHVDGIPMSALLAEAQQPRAVIVALHGGAANSSYFDCPNEPRLSLLRTAAAAGFTVLALDRPGYGASAVAAQELTAPARRVDLAYGAVEAHLGPIPLGAGVFVLAHSVGCELGIRMAADERGADLLGLELGGTGRHHHRVAVEILAARRDDLDWARKPKGLRSLLWKPAHLYPDDIIGGSTIGSRAPSFEADVVEHWQTDLPRLAAQVRVPVRYTLGDYEMVWQSGSEGLADVAALFTAAPRVVTHEQVNSGHNLSIGLGATAYHLSALSFVEECVLAREHAITEQGG